MANSFTYTIVQDVATLREELVMFEMDDLLGFDFETTGLDYVRDTPHGLSIANEDYGIYIVLSDEMLPYLVDWLGYMFGRSGVTWVAHNLKYDLHFLKKLCAGSDVHLPVAQAVDTLVAHWMLKEDDLHGLKELAKTYFGMVDLPGFKDLQKEVKAADKKRFKKIADVKITDIDINRLAEYAVRDSWLCRNLWPILQWELYQEELYERFRNVEMPFIYLLQKMEATGIYVLPGPLEELRLEAQSRLEELKAAWVEKTKSEEFPEGVNPGSPAQLRTLLFGTLGLKPTGVTDSGLDSTDALTLLRLSKEDTSGTVELLQQLRTVSKIVSTYLEPLLVKPVDGMLHGNANRAGTVTGRLCVAGNTKLETSRGTFCIEDYTPIVGDTITTHTGKPQRILRKFYKGKEQMYEVTLTNGSKITATAGHRFLTPNGWQHLGDLRPGSRVLTNPLSKVAAGNALLAGYPQDSLGTTYTAVPIVSIRSVGSLDVWDIEVEGDHSYVAQGFVNHNSSDNINLQNIPATGKFGELIRKALGAMPGYVVVVADYSQIELRLVAHYAQARNLLKAFRAGEDVHQAMADLIGILRRQGKTVNFSVVYGSSWRGVCDTIEEDGYPRPKDAEAKKWLSDFFAVNPEIDVLKARANAACRQRGYIKTIGGRHRHVQGLMSHDKYERARAERQVLSSLIQGSAADLIENAMLRLDPISEGFGAALCMQVHDELVYLCPVETAQQFVVSLGVEMAAVEKIFNLTVPIIAEAHAAVSWGEAKAG